MDRDARPVNDHLAMLLAWCGPDGPGLFLGLFLAGLAGSPLHCGPMCGPFVLGQASERMAAMPAARLCELSRLRAGLLAPYHAGRLTTYAALGAVAGGIGGFSSSGRLGGVLLLGGAALFLSQALGRLAPRWLAHLPGFARPAAPWVAWMGRTARRVDRRTRFGGLLLGLLLGFLPCGFLYAGLAAAASTGEVWRGAVGMLAFGAGTVPALVVVGWLGQAAQGLWARGMARVAPAIMALNAVVLVAAGARALAG